MTPLHKACRAGHLNVVQYLIIDKGVDISAKTAVSFTNVYPVNTTNTYHHPVHLIGKEYSVDLCLLYW